MTCTRPIATLVLLAATASAADKRLLNLVMPDVKVLAGVNVRGAAGSPLGRYVLGLVMERNQQFQQASKDFGVDPRSVREFLVASNSAPKYDTGIALARGSFHPSDVIAKAVDHGAVTETYKTVTIITDAKSALGLAFLNANILITGDMAGVKAAIDRAPAPWSMPAPLSARIAQLSAAEDAWLLSTVPASNLMPAKSAGSAQNVLQNVQRLSAGVKFGKVATVSALAQADTAETAQLLGNTLKLMMNLISAQTKQLAPESAQSLVVDPQGNQLNLSFHLTDAEFRKLYQMVAGAPKTPR
ncbi:MAG TPA: hypothetical protein VG456_04535 [Candidatus Sulfopaludibacter sp.]|jgi:hypothetical protein|nr:hypothetical protein [Candidatus Sulfopaludibacter sp.]